MRSDFTIIGAGLAGTLMACTLARAGHTVEVYERGPDLRDGSHSVAEQSMNLALSTRGMHALGRLGLDEAVDRMAVPLRGRLVLEVGQLPQYNSYGRRDGNHLRSVSRHGLNELLIEVAAATPGVTLHFNSRCGAVDFEGRKATIIDEKTHESRQVDFTALIGADGVDSTVRTEMQRVMPMDMHLAHESWGYKELIIPPAARGGWRMEAEAVHIWPRRESLLIAHPNLNGSFTCTLYLPLEGAQGFEALQAPRDVWRFFEQNFPDAMSHMPTLLEDFITNPVHKIVQVDCSPWHMEDRAILIGDAAHAVVPFYGQGMNAAFEDCLLLEECIERHGADLALAFAAFQARRKPDTDALASLSVRNFDEVRAGLVSPGYRMRELALTTLHQWFPDVMPLFQLVTFTRIPYSAALAQARRQDRWLTALAAGGVLGTVLATSWLMARRSPAPNGGAQEVPPAEEELEIELTGQDG